jgi:hypothetical protein
MIVNWTWTSEKRVRRKNDQRQDKSGPDWSGISILIYDPTFAELYAPNIHETMQHP